MNSTLRRPASIVSGAGVAPPVGTLMIMESALLVPLALLVGALLGGGAVAIIIAAARRGHRAAQVATATVPDGVDQVIDALESAAMVLDSSNTVIKTSPGAHALGLVWNRSLVHSGLVDIVDRVRRFGEPVTHDLELTRGPLGDAQLRLNVRVAPLGTRYMLVIADDRTEAHRLEAVRRDFVANISHELKTPIGAVGLLAEALEHASDDPEQVRKFAERMRTESARLAAMTQDIIELSRLQAADALADPVEVDVDAVIAAAIDKNRVAAEAGSIQLVSGGERNARVVGDEGMLITAVHNLIANAVQFSTKPSRVGIGVTTVDDVVEIAVTDQGVGIPDDELDRVFERFFRVDQARSRSTGGTGLGLSIVKHIVQNHRGDVRVWSQAGHGSTFTIRLPRAVGTARTVTPKQKARA
jgi:two-component system, OmpR family, sensor histidine kinase SenX3